MRYDLILTSLLSQHKYIFNCLAPYPYFSALQTCLNAPNAIFIILIKFKRKKTQFWDCNTTITTKISVTSLLFLFQHKLHIQCDWLMTSNGSIQLNFNDIFMTYDKWLCQKWKWSCKITVKRCHACLTCTTVHDF